MKSYSIQNLTYSTYICHSSSRFFSNLNDIEKWQATHYPANQISINTECNCSANIFAKIDNLPVTATVIFELEYIRLTASITQSLEIKIRSDVTKSFKKVIYGVNSSTADHQTRTVRFTGNSTVLAAYYQSKILPYTNEYVRLKYKGRWSVLRFLT